jgi:ureidoacrylate peracid hydrolase
MFQDTEIEVWLKSIKVDTLIFCGIDTAISVDSSLRDAFNRGYDVILISDATASINKTRYESTLDKVKEYYELVMDSREFNHHLQV